jgi:hypothetical protein
MDMSEEFSSIQERVFMLYEQVNDITNKEPIDIEELEMVLQEIRDLREALEPI